MSETDEAEAILRSAGTRADADIDVAGVALAFASFDRPRIGMARYREHVAGLAQEVAGEDVAAERGEANRRVLALNAVVLERHGYRGDTLTYDDLQNANLMRVIDRRKGLPVALGILYIAIGQALDWPVSGLAFPGHFVLRVDAEGERRIVDPFHGGRVLGPGDLRALLKAQAGDEAELEPRHYAAVGHREVLLRLQNNIKLRRRRTGDLAGAAATLERMIWLAPDVCELRREAADLQAGLGNLQMAIAHLERLVATEPSDPMRHRAAKRLQELRRRLN